MGDETVPQGSESGRSAFLRGADTVAAGLHWPSSSAFDGTDSEHEQFESSDVNAAKWGGETSGEASVVSSDDGTDDESRSERRDRRRRARAARSAAKPRARRVAQGGAALADVQARWDQAMALLPQAGAGVTADEIKTMGRWCSAVYQIYCRLSKERLLELSQRMGNAKATQILNGADGFMESLMKVEPVGNDSGTGQVGDKRGEVTSDEESDNNHQKEFYE